MEKKECFCNACGRKFVASKEVLKEDGLFVKKDWGYFSNKDLQVHEFVLCERCYDEMIKKFKIPVKVSEKNEIINP